jgi:hypothetical protein
MLINLKMMKLIVQKAALEIKLEIMNAKYNVMLNFVNSMEVIVKNSTRNSNLSTNKFFRIIRLSIPILSMYLNSKFMKLLKMMKLLN